MLMNVWLYLHIFGAVFYFLVSKILISKPYITQNVHEDQLEKVSPSLFLCLLHQPYLCEFDYRFPQARNKRQKNIFSNKPM